MDDGGCSRQALRRILDAHVPADAHEAAALAQFHHEVARLTTPCDRDADPVHVTASALVAGERGTVLLLHRRLGRWLQPGGHIEAGEPPAAAAHREGEEETGLTLYHPPGGPHLTQVDVHPAADGHTHLDLRYLVLAGTEDPLPPPGESPHVRWYRWDEAEAIAEPALAAGLRTARRLWEDLARTPVEEGAERAP